MKTSPHHRLLAAFALELQAAFKCSDAKSMSVAAELVELADRARFLGARPAGAEVPQEPCLLERS